MLDNKLEVGEESISFFVEVGKTLECKGYVLTNSINNDTYISIGDEGINIKLEEVSGILDCVFNEELEREAIGVFLMVSNKEVLAINELVCSNFNNTK